MGDIIEFPISDKCKLELLIERSNSIHKEFIVVSERFKRLWNEGIEEN